MPRSTRRSQELTMRLNGQDFLISEEKHIVSRHLNTQYFQMCRELKREVSCPICYWVPEGEAVERAMLVRICGHIQCTMCYILQEQSDDVTCSVCRQ